MRKDEKVRTKLFSSTDADMQKILFAVSAKVTESVKNADKIHQDRLLQIRVRHAAS